MGLKIWKQRKGVIGLRWFALGWLHLSLLDSQVHLQQSVESALRHRILRVYPSTPNLRVASIKPTRLVVLLYKLLHRFYSPKIVFMFH